MAAQALELLPRAAPISMEPQPTPSYLPHQGSLSGKLQPPGREELDGSESMGCGNTTHETRVPRAGETQLQG